MGTNTNIEWCDHTFSPWRGCTKVSPGCAHCYAEAQSKRNPAVLGQWGDDGGRVIASESYWGLPLKWDAEAAAAGERRKVFCLSLGDFAEGRRELAGPRQRLFALVGRTPNLDWLLLTKRPEVCVEHWPLWAGYALGGSIRPHVPIDSLLRDNLVIPNVWLGASAEDQPNFDRRVRLLRRIPAAVRFLSVEPMLGPIDARGELEGIDWVICGGESGPHARPFCLDWAESLLAQCRAAGTRFFFKQAGAHVHGRPEWLGLWGAVVSAPCGRCPGEQAVVLRDRKGGDLAELPERLRVREFPARKESPRA